MIGHSAYRVVWHGTSHPYSYFRLDQGKHFPSLVACLGIIFDMLDKGRGGIGGFILFWLVVGFGAICVVMLYRVTKNYLTIPKRKTDEADA